MQRQAKPKLPHSFVKFLISPDSFHWLIIVYQYFIIMTSCHYITDFYQNSRQGNEDNWMKTAYGISLLSKLTQTLPNISTISFFFFYYFPLLQYYYLSAYIQGPFPPKEGTNHVLAVATVAPRDRPHLKPRPVQDGYEGHFPFKCLSTIYRDYVGSIL